MRPAKKRWIYNGLTVPEGTALVRKPQPSSEQERLLVIGHAALEDVLTAPLKSLVDEREIPTLFDFRRCFLRTWLDNGWLIEDLATFRPTVVFIVHDPRDAFARQIIRGHVRRVGAREIWMVPPGIPWIATKNFCPAFDLSVEGVASWVARAVAMVD